MRLFVAVHPPPAALRELAAALAPLHGLPGADGLRWTAEDGRHVTLAFLGEVAGERLPALRDGLARAALGRPAHRLRLDGGGRFGDRVLWVGLAGDTPALQGLARGVTRVAGEVLGVPGGVSGAPGAVEEFSYHPHLTLARAGRAGRAGRGALREAAERLAGFRGAEWRVTGFQLMSSELTGGRPRYRTVESWGLTAG